jgi:hypothetical protein
LATDPYYPFLTEIVSDAIGPASTIRRIGRGTEHMAWLAETSQGPWVLRIRSARDRADVHRLDAAREVALMAHLRRHGVPWVPEEHRSDLVTLELRNLARVFET